MNIICLDTETTGIHTDDEVLQLSIIGGDGAVLFSEYFKPVRKISWVEAESVNGISPSDVKDCRPILYYKDTIEKILSSADVIVGYNLYKFDLTMLFNNGIQNCIKQNSIIVDVMLHFSSLYGEWNDRHGDYKWQKLIVCAEYYGYPGTHWHDALDDAKATLFCFYAMFGNPPQIPDCGSGVYRSCMWHRMSSTDRSSFSSRQSASSAPVRKKTGRILIALGIICAVNSVVILNPITAALSVIFFYFGIRRYKAYKSSLK